MKLLKEFNVMVNKDGVMKLLLLLDWHVSNLLLGHGHM